MINLTSGKKSEDEEKLFSFQWWLYKCYWPGESWYVELLRQFLQEIKRYGYPQCVFVLEQYGEKINLGVALTDITTRQPQLER